MPPPPVTARASDEPLASPRHARYLICMDPRTPDAITLQCRRCGAEIASSDIDLGRGLAKCGACHAVFGFEDQLGQGRPRRNKGPVPMPKQFAVSNEPDTLEITRRWFSPKYIFIALFCVMWNGFLVFWYGAAASSGSLIMMLFPILHVAAGVYLAYWTLAGFLNRTIIKVDQRHVEIRHQPLPWPGNRELAADEIDQLYCRQQVHHGRNGRTIHYDVEMVSRDGRTLKLVSSLPRAEEALFIEYAVEDHLGIEDRAVPGEFER